MREKICNIHQMTGKIVQTAVASQADWALSTKISNFWFDNWNITSVPPVYDTASI